MVTLDEAREWLRLDGTDNDPIIQSLLDALPGYIMVTTGMKPEQQDETPLVETVSKFLLILWYNAEQAESERLQKTIDSLLKAITLMVE